MPPTQKQHRRRAAERREQFDLNRAIVTGQIVQLWGRTGDVYARLRVSTRGKPVDDDANSAHVTLRFLNGQIGGEPVTLVSGMLIRVRGFLTSTEYTETLRRYLDEAHLSGFLSEVPEGDRRAWRDLAFRRLNLILNVSGVALLRSDGALEREIEWNLRKPRADALTVNHVVIEGIVVRRREFTYRNTPLLAVRLAVYDAWTDLRDGEVSEWGDVKRRAHYVTVLLVEGKAGGVEIALRDKQRVRFEGALSDHGWTTTIHESVVGTGDEAVLAMLNRLDENLRARLLEAQIQQEGGWVVAQSAIVYS